MSDCSICCTIGEDVTHLPLYVNGSEGIYVCLSCRLALTHLAEGMMRACTRSNIAFRKRQRAAEEKRSPCRPACDACRYQVSRDAFYGLLCSWPTGEKGALGIVDCNRARLTRGRCGPDGRYFEAREEGGVVGAPTVKETEDGPA